MKFRGTRDGAGILMPLNIREFCLAWPAGRIKVGPLPQVHCLPSSPLWITFDPPTWIVQLSQYCVLCWSQCHHLQLQTKQTDLVITALLVTFPMVGIRCGRYHGRCASPVLQYSAMQWRLSQNWYKLPCLACHRGPQCQGLGSGCLWLLLCCYNLLIIGSYCLGRSGCFLAVSVCHWISRLHVYLSLSTLLFVKFTGVYILKLEIMK